MAGSLRRAQAPAAGIVDGKAAAQAFRETGGLAHDADVGGVGRFARRQFGRHCLAGQALHLLDALLDVAGVEHAASAEREGVAPGAPAGVGLLFAGGIEHRDVGDPADMQPYRQHAVGKILLRQRYPGRDVTERDQLFIERRGNLAQAGDAGALAQERQGRVGQPAESHRIGGLQFDGPDGEARLLRWQGGGNRRDRLPLRRVGTRLQPVAQFLRPFFLAPQAFVAGLGRRRPRVRRKSHQRQDQRNPGGQRYRRTKHCPETAGAPVCPCFSCRGVRHGLAPWRG